MSSRENKEIESLLIFEIIGRPKEYLTESLNSIIEAINKEEGVKVINKEIKEPVLMKNEKDFYTSFAEVEVKTKEVMHLAMLMFKYMPAHVEIISPESISSSNNELSEIFSELVRKLHAYDEVARVIQAEKNILETKLKELIGKKEGGENSERNVKKERKK